LHRPLQLGLRPDRRGLVAVGHGPEQPALAGGGGRGRGRLAGRRWPVLGQAALEPLQHHRGALRGAGAFHAWRTLLEAIRVGGGASSASSQCPRVASARSRTVSLDLIRERTPPTRADSAVLIHAYPAAGLPR